MLVLGLVIGGLFRLPAGPLAAQGRPAILTAIDAAGTLRALDGDSWTVLGSELGRGATATDLAWHPTRPELLVIRRSFVRADPREPSYAIVALDLATGTEQAILDGVGPQAELVGPRYAPDGRSALARIECCLARQVLQFPIPPTGAEPSNRPASSFLAPEARDAMLVTTGAYAPDGRILMSAGCCIDAEPRTDARGLYLVTPDLNRAERIVPGVDGLPLGLGPGGAWIAVLEGSGLGAGSPTLIRYDLPAGERRVLFGPLDPRLEATGDVAPDGRIVVAQRHAADAPWPGLLDAWIVQPDGTATNATNGSIPDLTAVAWAPAAVVDGVRAAAAARPTVPTVPTAPGPSTATSAAATAEPAAGRRPILVYFSRRPESDTDLSAVFPVRRTAPDQGVAAAALRALIAGPTAEEASAGYFSELGGMLVGPSSRGGSDFEVTIDAGTATVRFWRLVQSAGIGQDARVSSAISATLRQFPTVRRVRILDEGGDCLFDMSGENRCLRD